MQSIVYCLYQHFCILSCTYFTLHTSIPLVFLFGSCSSLFCLSCLLVSHRTEAISEHEAQRQNDSHFHKARCLAGTSHRLRRNCKHSLAKILGNEFTTNSDCRLLVSFTGVPVWSFDTVSIDSDLDSVCTEQVRQHIHKRPGKRLWKRWREAGLIMK